MNAGPVQVYQTCMLVCTSLQIWLQEVFHVYLNKFENAVTHLFLVIFVIIDLLVWPPEIHSHQKIQFLIFIFWFETVSEYE